MSDFLSFLIAAAYATAVSLGVAAPDHTEAEVSANGAGVSETKVDARNEFKRTENKANLVYQSAIADCRKKPPAEKHTCLENAKAANEHAIAEAKAINDKTVAEAMAAAASPGLQARASK